MNRLIAALCALALVGCETTESFCRCASAELQAEAACADVFNTCVEVAAVLAGADVLEMGRAAAERAHDQRVEACGAGWAACVDEAAP